MDLAAADENPDFNSSDPSSYFSPSKEEGPPINETPCEQVLVLVTLLHLNTIVTIKL